METIFCDTIVWEQDTLTMRSKAQEYPCDIHVAQGYLPLTNEHKALVVRMEVCNLNLCELAKDSAILLHELGIPGSDHGKMDQVIGNLKSMSFYTINFHECLQKLALDGKWPQILISSAAFESAKQAYDDIMEQATATVARFMQEHESHEKNKPL